MNFVRLLLLGVAYLFASCSTNQIQTTNRHSAGAPVPAEVEEYVTKHRGWKRSDFRIKREGQAEGFAQYYVTYVPEEKTYRIGGGKSFAIYYDPVGHKVVKEMHFQ